MPLPPFSPVCAGLGPYQGMWVFVLFNSVGDTHVVRMLFCLNTCVQVLSALYSGSSKICYIGVLCVHYKKNYLCRTRHRKWFPYCVLFTKLHSVFLLSSIRSSCHCERQSSLRHRSRRVVGASLTPQYRWIPGQQKLLLRHSGKRNTTLQVL